MVMALRPSSFAIWRHSAKIFSLLVISGFMMVSIGILGVTLWLFTIVPTGFIPATDSGIFYCFGMVRMLEARNSW